MCGGKLCGQELACLACEGEGAEAQPGKGMEVITGEEGLEPSMDMDFYST